MGQKLLREYYELCEGGVCQDLLTEAEKKFVAEGGMILSGIMQKANTANGNNRVYPMEVLQKTGKRIFKMAPIHHHFEKKGWPESTVVIRFWIISIILALGNISLISPICLKLLGILSMKYGLSVLNTSLSFKYLSPISFN